MAYVKITKSGATVKQGNNGEVLSRFVGKDAEKRAKSEVRKLHKEHKPEQRNRGESARKRNEKK